MSEANRIRFKYSGRSWDLWLTDLSTKSEGTQRLYLEAIDTLLTFSGVSPEELYERYREEEKSEDPRDRGETARQVKLCMAKLEGEGYSKSWSGQVAKAVRSFFKASNVTLLIRDLDKPRHRTMKTAQPDEVRKFIEVANIRSKAIIAVAKDSGLRSGDIVKLKVEQVRKCIEAGVNFCKLTLQTQKEDIWAYSMLGPEALEYVKMWLDERDRLGIKSEWLFVNTLRDKGRRMKKSAVSPIFDRLQDKTGIEGLSAHSLRRFHTTNLTASGLDSNWVKLIQGKALDGSDKGYYDPSKIPELYREHYAAIAVFGRTKSEVNGLRRDIEAWKVASQGTEYEAERLAKENEELKSRLDKLEEYVKILAEGRDKK